MKVRRRILKKAIGVDIGGTKIAVAIVNEDGSIYERVNVATDTTSAEALFTTLVKTIDKVLDFSGMKIEQFSGIGIGLPGKVDEKNGIAVFQNNIPWANFPIVERLQKVYPDVKIRIDNDVKVAAYAEYVLSNLDKDEMFGYLTISTGIACTNILNHQIIRGAGFSGEIGFIPVPSSTGLKPVEKVAAGPAIQHFGQELYKDSSLTTADIFERWQQCDWEATQVIEQSITGVTLALYSMICLLDPKVIILGGSVALNNPKYVERLKSSLERLMHPEQTHVLENIRISDLEGRNGIVGAGFLVMMKD